jgi:glycosyltransferase involved in cell wall biosynthesis
VRDANDTVGLAAAISIALTLAEKADTRERARAIAARFDMDRMAERMLALYEQVEREKAA